MLSSFETQIINSLSKKMKQQLADLFFNNEITEGKVLLEQIKEIT